MDNCAGKLIRSNHRLMGTYVQLMPRMVQRRMEEMESKAAENAKAAEAAASASVGSPAAETSATSLPPQIPGLLETDVRPESHDSIIKPAGLDIPIELDSAVSKSTEVKLSAATPLTPASETVNPSVLSKSGDGQSYTSGFVAPIAGAQIESGSFMPSKQTSLSESVPVSTAAPSIVSKSTESLSGQERAPEVPPLSGQ